MKVSHFNVVVFVGVKLDYGQCMGWGVHYDPSHRDLLDFLVFISVKVACGQRMG